MCKVFCWVQANPVSIIGKRRVGAPVHNPFNSLQSYQYTYIYTLHYTYLQTPKALDEHAHVHVQYVYVYQGYVKRYSQVSWCTKHPMKFLTFKFDIICGHVLTYHIQVSSLNSKKIMARSSEILTCGSTTCMYHNCSNYTCTCTCTCTCGSGKLLDLHVPEMQ